MQLKLANDKELGVSMWDKVDREDFNNYKSEVWQRHQDTAARLSELERLIAEKTPDLIEEIKAAATEAFTNRDSIRAASEESETLLALISKESLSMSSSIAPLKSALEAAEAENTQLKQSIDECQRLRGDLTNAKVKADSLVAEIGTTLESARGLLVAADNVPSQVEAAAKLLSQCELLRENIQGVVDHAISRKITLDEVHNEVFGQELKGSDGSVEKIEGLRDKLKKSFDQGDNAINALKDKATADVTAVTTQLKDLMPGAMAAGLSAAYEAKANAEIATQQRLEKHFVSGILGLAAVSLIPFAVNIYLLTQGKDLIEVIRQTPVLQILPLYFPVLWFAYSTSKKVNLSKRLIEEYTHKAVLGKTFSGLSNQIDSLPKEHEVTQELRLRLLYNVLQVSAENPGKLITDYSKADHPVMEALENSSRLSGSIEAIQKIPGFSRLAEFLTARQAGVAAAEANKVADGLEVAKGLVTK